MEAQILLFIQNHIRQDWLTPIFKGITFLGDKGWFWISLSLSLLVFQKTRRLGCMCCMAMFFMVVINNMLIKNIVNRTRPWVTFPEIIPLGNLPDDSSFPSGHTAASFAVSIVLLLKTKKRFGIPALVLAVLIGLSRLYLGVHYPSDVLGGVVSGSLCAVLGLFTGPFVHNILSRIFPFWDEKKSDSDRQNV